MQTIRLIYSRNTTWYDIFSYLVRLVTWSPWSHVAMLLDDGTVIESTFLHGGVQIATMEEFKSRASTWEIREYDVVDAEAIKQACKSQLGKKYNWLALFGLLLHIGSWKGSGTWYCSELMNFGFVIGGSPRFQEKFDARIPPQLLYMLYSRFVASSNG